MSDTTCWFCERAASDESAAVKIQLQGVTTIRGTDVILKPELLDLESRLNLRQKILTLSVPRCGRCKAEHRARIWRPMAYVWAAGVIVTIITIPLIAIGVMEKTQPWGGLGWMAVFAGAMGFGHWKAKALEDASVKPIAAAMKHPYVEMSIKEGWKFSHRPAW